VADDPVVLLVGDVSALHDIGGLALGAAARVPLAVVLINNEGGRLFEQLPLARVADEATLRHFTTPHRCDFEHAAGLYGHAFTRVRTRSALAAALAAALARRACTVIEAVVPPQSAAEQQTRILAALG
jgi:2-succinyl-5-enolpyruvyl-6-hydroxy-3-cyclohexene-1-carboxylate synthase